MESEKTTAAAEKRDDHARKVEHEKRAEHEKAAGAGKKKLDNKIIYAAAAVVIIAIALGAYFLIGGAAQSVVSGDNVSVYYTGEFTNGTVFNSNVGQQPFNFTAGSDQLITGFSQGVIGMHVGQNKTLVLPENEAYGPVNPDLIISVPISAFENSTTYVGATVTTSEGYSGIVTAVNATNATVDFNSPLAGKTLVFRVQMAGIRK